MLVELSKEDLINLVCSVSPGYEKFDELQKVGAGTMWGGGFQTERWEWNKAFLKKLPEENLFQLYKLVITPIEDAIPGLILMN